MKIKTTITLSDSILKAIDLHLGSKRSRSEFLEIAAEKYIERLERSQAEKRDFEIIDRCSDSLNQEAEDVLEYQARL